jgi:hypothetical protein
LENGAMVICIMALGVVMAAASSKPANIKEESR